MVCRTIGVSDQWCVGPMVCRTNGVSDQWCVGPMVCRTNGVSDQWCVGPMVCRTDGQSPEVGGDPDINPYSAGIDFSRQNRSSVDVIV